MTVTLAPHPTTTHAPARDGLSPSALATFHALRIGGHAGPRAIAKSLDLPVVQVIDALASLAQRGLARNIGGDFDDIWAVID